MTDRDLRTRFDIQPVWIKARDDLAARIDSGEWKVGAYIPNEQDLAREYRISGGTMRKALNELQCTGRLERKQGRGTVITNRQATLFQLMYTCRDDAEHVLRTALVDKPVPADFNDMAAHVALALWTERAKPLLNGRDA